MITNRLPLGIDVEAAKSKLPSPKALYNEWLKETQERKADHRIDHDMVSNDLAIKYLGTASYDNVDLVEDLLEEGKKQ